MSHTTQPCSPLCLEAGHCPSCTPAAWAKVATPLRWLPPKNLPNRYDFSKHERRSALNVLINAAPAGTLRRTLQEHRLNGSGLYRIAPDGTLYICHRDDVSYAADSYITADWAVAVIQGQPDEESWQLLHSPTGSGPLQAAHYVNTATPAGPVHLWVAVCDLIDYLHVELQITSKTNGTRVTRDKVIASRIGQTGHEVRFAQWVTDQVEAAQLAS